MKKRIVIIGGCAAGPKVAAKAKRLNPENEISLYTKEDIISYSACGLPYFIEGSVPSPRNLIIRTPEDFRKLGINVYLNHECTKILPNEKSVIINTQKVEYDELVLAIGAKPFTPRIKNINLKGVYHLRTIHDGIEIKEKMKNSKRVIIVGGGYIAIELIEAFVANGLQVVVLEKFKRIMSHFDPEFSELIQIHIQENSKNLVEFVLNDEAVEFYGKDGFEGVRTFQGRKIDADFCILATGVTPNVEIAREAGIEIGRTGGIKVDNRMRTSIPNIWAAGDCTEEHCLITKRPMYVALGTIANKEGRVAAINLSGTCSNNCETFDGILGSAVTRYFGFTMSITGVTESRAIKIAQEVNIEPISATITKRDKAGYMPGSEDITLKLVADKRTGELMGAQAIGPGDADKRVNTVASALRSGLTVEEFLHLDLTYSPAYSSTIDPLLTAAYKLKAQLNS